jgi:xanthine dehydrogenase/oxidase
MDLSGPVLERAMFHIDNAYRWPNLSVTGRVCYTNLASNTAFRGFGGPQGMFICEMIMERIARTLNMSPTHVREINLYKQGELTHFKMPFDDKNLVGLWQQLKIKAEVATKEREIEAFNASNRYRKRGIALLPTKFGISFTATFMNQGAALVHIYKDGSVMVTHGGTEMGQGLHTKMAQLTASAFGIPLELVHISDTSTDKVANTSPTAASFSSDINGMAILHACDQIKERLAPVYAEHKGKKWAEVVNIAYFQRINLSAHGFHKVPMVSWDWNTCSGRPFRYFTQGAACAMVEVDTLTGDTQILTADIVMDLGSSLNPTIDVGQIEGAWAQGVGWCTVEELMFGGNQEHKWIPKGLLHTRGPGAYKIPSFGDVPIRLNVHLLPNVREPRGPFSSKAVGEPPLFLGSAVFFAIKDALCAARKDAGVGYLLHHPFTLTFSILFLCLFLISYMYYWLCLYNSEGWFPMDSPASVERIRMAAPDALTARFTDPAAAFRAQLSC